MADRNANILISLRNTASAETQRLIADNRSLIASYVQAGASIEQAERKLLGLAQAESRARAAAGDLSGSERVLTAALSSVTRESTTAYAAQAQLARVQQGGAGIAQQFGDSLKSSVLGIIGPAALATAAFTALKGAIDLTEEGFKLKAVLDETNRSIAIQLRGVRDSGQVFQEASGFAAQYGLTQAETNQALLASVGILRNSTSSANELLGVLTRLQIVSPEQSLQEAALAVKELQSGDITSLVKRFEISRSEANKMKEEIKGGGDAVTAIARYLDDAGVGMDVLGNRTQGAAGKMRILAQETENLMLALGGQAGGPGEFILDQRIALTANATRVLSGDTKTLTADMQALAGALNPIALLTNTVSASNEFAISKFNELTGSALPPTFFSINGLTEAWNRFTGAVESTPSNIPGSQRIKEQLQGITRDANVAADAVAAALGNKPLPHLTDKGPSVGGANKSVIEGLFGGGAAAIKQLKKDDAEKAALQDALFENDLKRAKDNAAKIALLQGKLAGTSDPVARARLEGQIIDLRNSGAKSHTSELDKQLKLNEANYDSVDKQRQAVIDLGVAQARNRLDSLKDQDALKKANNILNNADSSADLKARAQARKDLILAEAQKRDFEQQQLQATASSSIINGKLFQSVPGGGGPLQSPPSVGGTPALTPTAGGGQRGAPGGGGGRELIIQMDGQQVAKLILPYAWAELDGAIQHARITQGA